MAEHTFDIRSAHTLVMQQYVDTFRRGEYVGPEKLLLAAILDDAVRNIANTIRQTTWTAKDDSLK